ncbi:hypothetical protein [Mesorhizobium sp. B2-3-6]|uniref:hypothetical protein n=1 Tax=Mesorhizobium sp. B2-3-6 TaxID=2589957 RepID=UPI0011278049|nr:hypothetical protein [Mesorhizobium sp. B2-3-6]TPM19770.1 hypothetical protein FJ953_15325 [Mesorhizobium sp. B2-3-6]
MGYINLPTLDIDFLRPSKMSFDTKGGGLEGGRNGLGESITIETSGGGVLIGSYEECFVQARESHEYINWVAARMNSSVRFMNVPIKSDWMGPFPVDTRSIPRPIIDGIPHSDTSLFSDGAGYSQFSVFGTMGAAAALNAGQITLNLYGAERNLRWSDWFSIYHPIKGWRAYRYWETTDPVPITETVEGVVYTGSQYVLSLDRPLREAVPAGTRIEFARPRCVMKFPSGFTLPWDAQGFWQSSPTIQFVEGF